MTEFKSKILDDVVSFPIEDRIAKRITPERAFQLLGNAQKAMLEILEDEANSGEELATIFYHYQEVYNYTSDNPQAEITPDLRKVFSDDEAVSVVKKFILFKNK